MKRVHLIIHGLVQGVFFRSQACEKARALGVTGWTANNADGTVAITAEGPSNLVEQLIDWCHSGPSTSRVEKVDVEESTFTGEFEGFEIRY